METLIKESKIVLDINDLHANVENVPILKGVDLKIRSGEIHALSLIHI